MPTFFETFQVVLVDGDRIVRADVRIFACIVRFFTTTILQAIQLVYVYDACLNHPLWIGKRQHL